MTPETNKPASYLLAPSAVAADNTARIDWGWTRHQLSDGRPYWINDDGDHVYPLTDPHRLMTLRRGSRIYRGHGYWNMPDIDTALDLARAREIIIK
jgi:hypothetical protein